MSSAAVPKLYVSYSNRDKETVFRLVEDLIKNGIDTIFDENLVQDGKSWQEALMKGITEADCILVLITPDSISSKYVMNELGMARALAMKESKLLLPVIFGDVEIPEFIKDIQVIFWRDNYQEVIDRIIRAVFNYFRGAQSKSKNTDILTPPPPDPKKPEIDTKNNTGINYWLFKMNPDTWKIEKLKLKTKTFFSTHYYEERRPEYELLKKVGKGDIVLAFASGTYNRIVCEMEVTDPAGPNNAQGESLAMFVRKLIEQNISLDNIRHIIPAIAPKLEQDQTPPELFFSISETAYSDILNFTEEDPNTGRKLIQPYFLTEGNHENTIDQLEFANDIESFASVIALQKVKPPLAIGLFGNWGSGKSFFMEKLSERIDEMCGKDDEYIQNVVQVKFNSWHYSDSNLWASLITEIFDSLNKYAKKEKQESEISKLKRTLNTTSIEREVVDEKRKALEVSVKALELDQARKRKKLEDISGIGLLKYILRDKRINKDLSELNNENIETVISDVNKVDEYITEVKDTGNKALFFFKEFFNLQGWRWVLVIAIAIFVAVGVPLLKNIFPAEWQNFTWQLRTYSALIAGFVANFVAAIKPYKKNINDALERLQSVKKTLESRAQIASPQLTEKEKELALLTSLLTNIDLKIEKTKENINEILSGRRLQKFIDDRTKDENYSSALGVISRIRKDFVTLDMLLREQHSLTDEEKGELFNPENVQLKIDRVVLYIDDLDRCNEDVVVKVLEAIHLLLAFKLFVVIVGVDPRWLNNALSEKYKNLFGNNSTINRTAGAKQGEGDTKEQAQLNSFLGAATSYDYLEKIFQIPFALKPINKDGRENLIKYLISEEMDTEKNTDIKTGNLAAPQNSETSQNPSTPVAGEYINVEGNNTVVIGNEKNKAKKQILERLVFSKDELEYMQKISSLFGNTPRTINRYVNIYRIIKAHGSLNVTGNFSKDEFMPIMIILGIIVGWASFAEDFIDGIKKAGDTQKFEEFISNSNLPEQLKEIIKPLSVDIKNLSMKNVRRNIDLISRFSFRTLLKQG